MSRSFQTPDSNNAWIGSIAQGVSTVPFVGGILAGFVSPSMTASYVKDIEGNVIDTRTGWQIEQRLLAVSVLLIVVIVIVSRRAR